MCYSWAQHKQMYTLHEDSRPTIWGIYVYWRCHCALWTRGWEMCIILNMYIHLF